MRNIVQPTNHDAADTAFVSRWASVLALGGPDAEESDEAYECFADGMSALLWEHWQAPYAYLRCIGRPPERIAPCLSLLESMLSAWKGTRPEWWIYQGRFRLWLLAALREFAHYGLHIIAGMSLSGGLTIPYRFLPFEQELAPVLRQKPDPEYLFNQVWAYALYVRARGLLIVNQDSIGQAHLNDLFLPFLVNDPTDIERRERGSVIGRSEEEFAMALSHLRCNYNRLLREVVQATVASPHDFEEEWAELLL